MKSKKKCNFMYEDFYGSFEEEEHIKNLPKKFIKFNGLGNLKAHPTIFFVEHFQFHNNHRALFRYFPTSIEGLAA